MLSIDFYRLAATYGISASKDDFLDAYEAHLNIDSALPIQLLREPNLDPWSASVTEDRFCFGDWGGAMWAVSRQQMFAALLADIDCYRRYPTDFRTIDNGGLLLMKGDAELLRLQPMKQESVDPLMRKRCETALRGLMSGQQARLLKRVSRLPDMARLMRLPLYGERQQGLCWVSPSSIAQGWKATLEALGVTVRVHQAQGDVAKVLGFVSWQHFAAYWTAMPAHQPMVVSHYKQNSFKMYPDLPAGLAAFCTEVRSQRTEVATVEMQSSGGFGFIGNAKRQATPGQQHPMLDDTLIFLGAPDEVEGSDAYLAHTAHLAHLAGDELCRAWRNLLMLESSVEARLAASDERMGFQNATVFQGLRLSAEKFAGMSSVARIEKLRPDGWLDDSLPGISDSFRHPGLWSGDSYKLELANYFGPTTLKYDYGRHLLASWNGVTPEEFARLKSALGHE